MARLDDATLAALLLTSRLVADGPPPLKAREFWALVESVGGDPAVLLAGFDGAESVDGEPFAGLEPEQVARIEGLLDRATAFAFALEDAERSGINIVSAFDVRYPARLRARLGHQAPPALYTAGPVGLLSGPSIAIVGSRHVGPEAAEVAQQWAQVAVERDLTVISGGATGVDQLAMAAALDAGGRSVGVLADALAQRIRQPEVRRAIHDSRLCLATPYPPSAPFSVGAAMGRNKLVYALADVTFIVASGQDEGGTWAGGTEALTKGIGRVAVWRGTGEGPGNAALTKRGALEVTDIGATLDDLISEPRGDHGIGPGS